jgi:hypothetical protein
MQINTWRAARGGTAVDKVAQIFNLPYRRIAFCRVLASSQRQLPSSAQPITNQLCSAVEVLVGVVTSGEGTRAG